MRVVRAEELGGSAPGSTAGLAVDWLEGPHNGDRLDVGLVTVAPGGAAPAHAHIGGQVIIVLTGQCFVESEQGRVVAGPGDVVITPPGEVHTHGSEGGLPLSHLTVTTGGYTLPD